MRYWALLSIPISILVGVSCDKLWSSSIVDCGRPGFTCPDGYTPDMPLSESDGGAGGGDGGGSSDGGGSPGTDMGTVIPAGYTSVYTLSDTPRTTLVGTSDGRVRTYSFNGSGSTFAFVNQFTEESGIPIVGVWRGNLYGSGTPNNFTIVVPKTNKIYTHLNNAVGVLKSAPQILNGIWSSRRNGQNNTPIYNNVKVYFPANNGKVIEADVQQSPTLSLGNLSEIDLGVTSTINAVGGVQQAGSDSSMRFCAPSPCPNTDVAWAAGDAGKLFNRDDAGWHLVVLASGTLPTTAQLFGVASGLSGMSEAPPAFALGKDGVYAERPSGDLSQWQTLLSSPFGTTTLNAVCYIDNSEAWAVGEGGTVYHYFGYMDPPAWNKVTLPNLGKDLSKVSLRAVHCADSTYDGTTQRPRRVTIVGSNNTLLFGEDSSGMGISYAWSLVE